jgi:hypothetical protein
MMLVLGAMADLDEYEFLVLGLEFSSVELGACDWTGGFILGGRMWSSRTLPLLPAADHGFGMHLRMGFIQ